MSASIVLVGELNPYGADPRMALYHMPRHASGNRLREILGLRDHTYASIAKVNLCDVSWSIIWARLRAFNVVLSEHGTIVMLGTKVRQAFGVETIPFFSAHRFEAATDFPRMARDRVLPSFAGATFVSLPHPSGLNRMWDVPGSRERARDLLRVVCADVPWGEIL